MKTNKVKNNVGPLKDLYRRFACLAPEFADHLYISANTPLSLKMHLQLKSGMYHEIVSATVNPMDYTSADEFGRDYLCAELMSKYPNWDLGIDPTAVCLSKFKKSEEQCWLTNSAWSRKMLLSDSSIGITTASVLHTARRKISNLLGEFSWTEASEYFDWGPGATTSLPRAKGDAYYKFSAVEVEASYNTRVLVDALKAWAPTWDFRVKYVRGSRVTTVPKNAKTDRAIAIEPDLNMFFQKGIGGVIRNRLNRIGLLRRTAQQQNAELARLGSIDGSLATIDLSSASDTIAMQVVQMLLPEDWFSAVEHCRSREALLPSGEWIFLEKVSSMGNGFTFELETLIFWAISSAVSELHRCQDRRLLVYGDDIIVPSSISAELISVLDTFGFTTNAKKTFSTGPFRESCGKHYFLGVDVTPFYVRRPIDSVDRVYWAANTVKQYSRLVWGLDARWKSLYDWTVDHLPSFWRRVRIPDGYGMDSGLVVDFDEARPLRADWQLFGYSFRSVRKRNRFIGSEGHGRLLKSLFWLERERLGDYGSEVLKSSGYTVGWSIAPQWPNYGPWL